MVFIFGKENSEWNLKPAFLLAEVVMKLKLFSGHGKVHKSIYEAGSVYSLEQERKREVNILAIFNEQNDNRTIGGVLW